MTSTIPGILITAGTTSHIALPSKNTGESIRAAIGCRTFDVVHLGDGMDVFVDDEGAINGSPLNLALTIVAHRFGVPAVLFGSGVVVGTDNTNGDTIGLTQQQQRQIAEAMNSKPDSDTIDRLCESLAPLPGIVALLRAVQ